MIMKERVARKNVKEAISKESNEFDLLYAKVQDFVEHSDDQEKTDELLSLLDEENRLKLMNFIKDKKKAIFEKNRKNTSAAVNHNENLKITKFIANLQELGLPKHYFAEEVNNYFTFHCMRN